MTKIADSELSVAYEAVLARLDAVADSDLASDLRFDLGRAGLAAMQVWTFLDGHGAADRFAALAKVVPDFDAQSLGDLLLLARAAMFVDRQVVQASSSHSTAKVPAALLDAGYSLRASMLRVIEYNLDDNADVVRRVAEIREGSGHLDLSHDLDALADLYVAHASALAVDKKRYDAKDAKDARSTAGAIRAALAHGAPQTLAEKQKRARQVWSLLTKTYEQVARGGSFLFWSERDARFPKLISASRRGHKSAAAEEPGASDTGSTPAA